MCGIAGMLQFDRNLLDHEARALITVSRMRDAIRHRGPDARGAWIGRHAAFAHARLAVIDPERGLQPMRRVLNGNEYVVCYNGEIYNAGELRLDLQKKGYSFETTCDTEALLWAYVEYGPDCVKLLEGIFAFAIWDGARDRCFLARDPMGVKPLFFARRDGAWLFASEIKALLAHGAVRPLIRREGLCEILGVGPGRTPGFGVFDGVEELRPGERMLINRDGENRSLYWRLEAREHREEYPETVERVRELLFSAIERQLVSDVGLCTFLSGGLDSSILTARAAKHARERGERIQTYAFDYVDNDRFFHATAFQPDSDRPFAQEVSEFCDTDHRVLLCHNHDLPAALDDAMRARDLPGMADVDASLLLFCRKVRSEHVVALSGECADEVFGGYPWFHRQEFFQARAFPWLTDPEARLQALNPDVLRNCQVREHMRARYEAMLREVPRLDGESPFEARRREISYLNLYGFMQTLLERKDRMSMACGLEVRVPFADAKLVEYVFNAPWEMKAHHGEAKGLLRSVCEGELPESVLRRKKSPYPKTHHPLYEELVHARAREVLSDPLSPVRDWLEFSHFRQLLEGRADPGKPWFGQLMAGPQLLAWILQVNQWLQEYKVEFLE